MDNMEDQINSILNNPDMMQQIMAMAQAMNQPPPKPENEPSMQEPSSFAFGEIDPSMIQKIAGFAKHTGIDGNQRSLLKALSPYISQDRIWKLEKAMRAAKMANIASSFLGNGGLSFLTGR